MVPFRSRDVGELVKAVGRRRRLQQSFLAISDCASAIIEPEVIKRRIKRTSQLQARYGTLSPGRVRKSGEEQIAATP